MSSPPFVADEETKIVAKSPMVDSPRAIVTPRARIDKQDLRRRISIPYYLLAAMAEAVRARDPVTAAEGACRGEEDEASEAPMVVFVNSRSGGRNGAVLKGRLQELMGGDQVFDLSAVKPSDFFQYGLACLEKLAYIGDTCAKATREKMRIMVAGGDGTVGWVLGSLAVLAVQKREPIPPTGIIPLGTGNDLSRSFSWGGSFPFAWKSAVKSSLHRAVTGPVCFLDRMSILKGRCPRRFLALKESSIITLV